MLDALIVNWHVNPEIFRIGGFALRWYSLLFVGGFILGWYIFRWFFRREGIREELLDSLLYTLLIGTIVGARLGHCLFYDADYFFTSEHWTEIFWPFQNGQFTGFTGLASHGAAIGILIALWLYQRRYKLNAWWFLDRLVVVVALGGAFVRIGNLFNSEIYGCETTLPWGFIFEREGETVPKHPTGLYEAVAYLLIFAVSLVYYHRKKGQFKTGSIFGWWLVALFGARFLIEFVKTNGVIEGSVLLKGQWLSIPFIAGGLVIAWLAAKGKLPQGAFPHGEDPKVVAERKEKERKEQEKKRRKEMAKKNSNQGK
jgi:prolipoprotein diacylglyceryl transferase